MSARYFKFTLGVMIAGLLVLAACTPVAGTFGTEPVGLGGGVDSGTGQQGAGTGTGQQGLGGDTGQQGLGTDTGSGQSALQVLPGGWINYSDGTFMFTVGYPSNFVLRSLYGGDLSGMIPAPVAVFRFFNPTAANSAVPGELADFEVRVFNSGGFTLDRWLVSTGLTTSASSQPFNTKYVAGYKLCATVMIAPACSYFTYGNGWIYQLVSTTQTGDAMLQTFMLTGGTITNPNPQGTPPVFPPTATSPAPQGNRSPSSLWMIYKDARYSFSVAYPSNFVLRNVFIGDLSSLNPAPVAAFRFYNPVTANNNSLGEPADFEIRVHNAEGLSLDRWLVSTGLTASAAPQPFNTMYVAGYKLCSTIMIAPGACSYYVYGNGWVYQLIPSSPAGDSMLQSFMLVYGPNTGGPSPWGSSPLGPWVVYTDATFKFSVAYPSTFTLRTLYGSNITGFNPSPVALFRFLNPTSAGSSVPNELADLEIRVFNSSGIQLDRWLASAGLTTVSLQPFTALYISGYKVCSSTMIAPACSYFFIGNGWIYQVIPASQTGDSMLQTFMVMP